MAIADFTEEHPGDLLDHAAELEAEAGQLREQAEQLRQRAKTREAQAAALRSKARRILNPELGVQVRRAPARPADPLMGAAALAVEDMENTITATRLASELNIGSKRAQELLEGLLAAEKVERNSNGGYRAIDPEIARVRDAVIELGAGSTAELAAHIGMPEATLRWYVAHLRQRGILNVPSEGRWEYVTVGPERVQTRRPRRLPPEREVVDKTLAQNRGRTVEYTGKPMVEDSGSQRAAAERRKRGGHTKKRKK